MISERSRGTKRGLETVALSAMATAALIAGCTSSGPSPADANWVGAAGGAHDDTLVIAVPPGAAFPTTALEALAGAAGISLQEVTLASEGDGRLSPAALQGVDILLGVDPQWLAVSGLFGESSEAIESGQSRGELHALSDEGAGDESSGIFATTYGFDDACVLVNRLWFSANDLPLPKDLASLNEDQIRSIVGASNPHLSPYALAALPMWDDQWEGWKPGPVLESPRVLPGRVGSVLEPERAGGLSVPNSRYRVLPQSCVKRETAAVVITEREQRAQTAQDLVDFLLTDAGQQVVSENFLAIPLKPDLMQSADADEVPEVLGIHAEARSPYLGAQLRDALSQWDRLFSAAETD